MLRHCYKPWTFKKMKNTKKDLVTLLENKAKEKAYFYHSDSTHL